MFYVLIFSLAAVILIVAFFTAMARRRRTMQDDAVHATAADGHTIHGAHGTHPDAARRTARQSARSPSTTGASGTDAGGQDRRVSPMILAEPLEGPADGARPSQPRRSRAACAGWWRLDEVTAAGTPSAAATAADAPAVARPPSAGSRTLTTSSPS